MSDRKGSEEKAVRTLVKEGVTALQEIEDYKVD